MISGTKKSGHFENKTYVTIKKVGSLLMKTWSRIKRSGHFELKTVSPFKRLPTWHFRPNGHKWSPESGQPITVDSVHGLCSCWPSQGAGGRGPRMDIMLFFYEPQIKHTFILDKLRGICDSQGNNYWNKKSNIIKMKYINQ